MFLLYIILYVESSPLEMIFAFQIECSLDFEIFYILGHNFLLLFFECPNLIHTRTLLPISYLQLAVKRY